MILRRVIEHVRHQHWTAIWIDLVIDILGVFKGQAHRRMRLGQGRVERQCGARVFQHSAQT